MTSHNSKMLLPLKKCFVIFSHTVSIEELFGPDTKKFCELTELFHELPNHHSQGLDVEKI